MLGWYAQFRVLIFLLLIGSFACPVARGEIRPCDEILASFMTENYQPKPSSPLINSIENEHEGQPSLVHLNKVLSTAEKLAGKERLLKALQEDGTGEIEVQKVDELVTRIASHPVTGYEATPKYSIYCHGFCFGRAVGTHIEALREGIDPSSIRKIWAVGDMKEYHFHVATIFKTKIGWRVADPDDGKSVSIQEWVDHMTDNTKPGNTTSFFISDARRFSVNRPNHYDPIDLFGLKRENDYYAGYFTDYFDGLVKK